ncbi:RES domain-containing protein [Paraburkholderia caffeinilytica]|uniref:RES domain-containing protein n=1 Tax=Paraburkholderia caffeinilytica TaxID=1761016 RepID=UPI000E214648|nr:RES domain-containing protein [Paraburkholderia caffeinilytica]CAB3778597.1 hypothetical protein LMG28690_00735 [Paraburkholderia caffeinilytica]
MNNNPTLRYLQNKRLIGALERLSNQRAEPSKFMPLISDLFNGTSLHAMHVENGVIYRGRHNEGGRLFSTVEELSYPRPEYVRAKGRLNDVRQSVLYAALCELGTIIEMAVSLHATFTISKIQRRSDSSMFFFPLGLKSPPEFTAQCKADALVRDFLKGQITRQRVEFDDYNCTIALGDMLLRKPIANYSASPYSGVAYPSVRSAISSNTTTYNLAMTPEVFDKNYMIVECSVYVLTHDVDHYQLNEVNRGKVLSDGKIDWLFGHAEMTNRTARGLWADGYVNPNLALSAPDI